MSNNALTKENIVNKLLKFILSILDERGVILLDDNYQLTQNFPIEKSSPGQYNCKVKVLKMKKNLDVIVAINDEIDGLKLPEGALVLDAYIKIASTAGTTGIFDLGLRAGFVQDESLEGHLALEVPYVEDPNGLVQAADAGGQAVLKRAAAASIMGESLGKVGKGGLQVFATCTEATQDTVANPAQFEAAVIYSLEF